MEDKATPRNGVLNSVPELMFTSWTHVILTVVRHAKIDPFEPQGCQFSPTIMAHQSTFHDNTLLAAVASAQPLTVNVVVKPDPVHEDLPWTIVDTDGLLWPGHPIRMQILGTYRYFLTALDYTVVTNRQCAWFSISTKRKGWPSRLKAYRWIPEPPPPLVLPPRIPRSLTGPGIPGDPTT